jgi:hypothetical protein
VTDVLRTIPVSDSRQKKADREKELPVGFFVSAARRP